MEREINADISELGLTSDRVSITSKGLVPVENVDEGMEDYLNTLRINGFDVEFNVEEVMRYRVSNIFDSKYTVKLPVARPQGI